MKQVPERPAMAPPRQEAKKEKISRRERAFVLGPVLPCLAFCVIFGVFFQAPAPGSAGVVFVAMAMGASVLWVVVASLALALDRGIRHTDWSSFKRQDQAPGDGVGTDWDTRTGSFSWMHDWENLQFDKDDHHP